jgi:hypothetical protein
MKIARVKKGDVIQMPAPRAGAFDGWITSKVENTGLMLKVSFGDGGGYLLSDEELAGLGYYHLTPAKKKLLGIVKPSKSK